MTDQPLTVPKLKARQLRAISAFMTSPTTAEALEKVGLNRATWWRWRRDERFEQALADAVSAAFSDSLLAVKAANLEAIDVIRRTMKSKNEGLALSAATQLLVYSLRVASLLDTEKRIRALEEAAGLREKRNTPKGNGLPGGER